MASMVTSTGDLPIYVHTDRPVPTGKVASLEIGGHEAVIYLTQEDVDLLVAELSAVSS